MRILSTVNKDKVGELMTLDTEEELCFMVGRDGDSLATPFQCDKCHLGRELVEGGKPSIRCTFGYSNAFVKPIWMPFVTRIKLLKKN